jgi:hypothetical protein
MIMEHRYTYPKVIAKVVEVREPGPPVPAQRARSQRELVAASLIRRPGPDKRSPGR